MTKKLRRVNNGKRRRNESDNKKSSQRKVQKRSTEGFVQYDEKGLKSAEPLALVNSHAHGHSSKNNNNKKTLQSGNAIGTLIGHHATATPSEDDKLFDLATIAPSPPPPSNSEARTYTKREGDADKQSRNQANLVTLRDNYSEAIQRVALNNQAQPSHYLYSSTPYVRHHPYTYAHAPRFCPPIANATLQRVRLVHPSQQRYYQPTRYTQPHVYYRSYQRSPHPRPQYLTPLPARAPCLQTKAKKHVPSLPPIIPQAYQNLMKKLDKDTIANFQKLLSFKQEHGNMNVPYEFPPDPILGRWVSNQRYQYQLHNINIRTIPKELVELLNKEGFEWSGANAEWDEMYWKAQASRHNNAFLVEIVNNKKLKTWMIEQQDQYRKYKIEGQESSTLTQEKAHKLQAIGFSEHETPLVV